MYETTINSDPRGIRHVLTLRRDRMPPPWPIILNFLRTEKRRGAPKESLLLEFISQLLALFATRSVPPIATGGPVPFF